MSQVRTSQVRAGQVRALRFAPSGRPWTDRAGEVRARQVARERSHRSRRIQRGSRTRDSRRRAALGDSFARVRLAVARLAPVRSRRSDRLRPGWHSAGRRGRVSCRPGARAGRRSTRSSERPCSSTRAASPREPDGAEAGRQAARASRVQSRRMVAKPSPAPQWSCPLSREMAYRFAVLIVSLTAAGQSSQTLTAPVGSR